MRPIRELWDEASEYCTPRDDLTWDEWNDEEKVGWNEGHPSETDSKGEDTSKADPPPLVPNHVVLYERQIVILRQLETEINRRGWAASCQLIRARVPIVKLRDREFGFDFDVSVEQLDGLASSGLIVRALNDNPLLRPIIKVLKLTLHSHELHRSCYSYCTTFRYCTRLLVAHSQS